MGHYPILDPGDVMKAAPKQSTGGARWSPVEPRGPALADFFAESTSKLDQVRQIIKTVLEICGEWFFVVLFETENNCFPGEETNNTTFDSQF